MRGSSLKKDSILPMTLASCSCHPKKTSINLLKLRLLTKSLKKSSRVLNPMNKSLIFILGLYRSFGTTFLGGSCRFEPSCSTYAVEAAKTHSFFTALKLILIRLSKCHPLGPFGYDPVPQGAKEML